MRYFGLSDLFSTVRWIYSNENEKLEKEFSSFVGTKYAIGTSFGRTALYAGLKAIDVKGKEVILPSFICAVVRHAVTIAGGIPKFVDVDFDTFTYNLDALKKNVTEKTKAIIIPHYFGHVATNLEAVNKIAKQNGIILIEDCAHSLGAKLNGEKIGAFGDFSIFSLTKGMVNFGGGLLATNDQTLFRKVKSVIDQEKVSIVKRIVDFPLILEYGIEQAIEKLIFDRVKRSVFKWWLNDVPQIMSVVRRFLIKLVKMPKIVMRINGRKKKYTTDKQEGLLHTERYQQGIHMEPIIAALGRTQLRKIDSLIERRKKITKELATIDSFHLKKNENLTEKASYTYALFRFSGKNIFKIAERCKKQGLLLRPTWPTRQKLWNHQDTEVVKKFGEEILTWVINPMVSKKEIEKFIRIMGRLS